ncbi:hypothetical protein ACGFNP_47060 [Nonomuraea sp. NPDC049269]|uniref:hypothetical protein n=1 Tax=Nonomuraea sp. NPDC049269 TaxID=3364349 RepID=UPI00372072A8
MRLTDCYACLDGPDPESGLKLVAPDIRFLITLPDRRIAGEGRDELAGYILGRNGLRVRRRRVRAR